MNRWGLTGAGAWLVASVARAAPHAQDVYDWDDETVPINPQLHAGHAAFLAVVLILAILWLLAWIGDRRAEARRASRLSSSSRSSAAGQPADPLRPE